jgi:hypothetical protein
MAGDQVLVDLSQRGTALDTSPLGEGTSSGEDAAAAHLEA